jgi:hypothetical protein
MNEMTTEEKKVYAKMLDLIDLEVTTNRTPLNIARLKDFVEVVNLRIEGVNYKSEYDV